MAKCITEKTLLSLSQLRASLTEELNNAPIVIMSYLEQSLKVYKNIENPFSHAPEIISIAETIKEMTERAANKENGPNEPLDFYLKVTENTQLQNKTALVVLRTHTTYSGDRLYLYPYIANLADYNPLHYQWGGGQV